MAIESSLSSSMKRNQRGYQEQSLDMEQEPVEPEAERTTITSIEAEFGFKQ